MNATFSFTFLHSQGPPIQSPSEFNCIHIVAKFFKSENRRESTPIGLDILRKRGDILRKREDSMYKLDDILCKQEGNVRKLDGIPHGEGVSLLWGGPVLWNMVVCSW